jgi:hypothetical protein
MAKKVSVIKNAASFSPATPVQVSGYYRSGNSKLLGDFSKAMAKRKQTKNPKTVKNSFEYSPATPIAVTKHFRSGGEHYLTARQRAILSGQQPLFAGADDTDRDFLRARGKLKNPAQPTQTNLQAAYRDGATKANLKKALRAGGMELTKVETMLSKLKPQAAKNPQNSMNNTSRNKTNPAKKSPTISPQVRQIAKSLNITITKNGNRFEYKTKDGKVHASMQKATDAAKRLLTQTQNPFGFGIREGVAKKLAKSKLKSLGTARDKAKRVFDEAQKRYDSVAQMANPNRKPTRKNGMVGDIYEEFQGRPVTGEYEAVAPNGTPDELAELGTLAWLEIVDSIGQYLTINFDTPNNQAPILCADVRGNLHIVGGTYRMTDNAGETFGSITRIAYIAHKDHIENGKEFEFVHEFSEESGGELPKLKIDKDGLFKVSGGVYKLGSPGIID